MATSCIWLIAASSRVLTVPYRTSSAACSLALFSCGWCLWVLTGLSVLHFSYSVHFLLPASSSSYLIWFCLVWLCFVWFCFVWLLLLAPSASASVSCYFQFRLLTASSGSYFVRFFLVCFLLACCLYTTPHLTPAPHPAYASISFQSWAQNVPSRACRLCRLLLDGCFEGRCSCDGSFSCFVGFAPYALLQCRHRTSFWTLAP